MVAFTNRGHGDYGASKDMEDIVAVVDGRAALAGEVQRADSALQTYVAETFAAWLSERRFLHAVPGHLPGNMEPEARADIVIDRIRAIANRTR